MEQFIAEIEKAFAFLEDKTYEKSDFISHMKQILKDAMLVGNGHKEQMEKLLYKNWELRNNQRNYYAGHKQLLSICKQLEKELDTKVTNILKMGTYSIERFKNTVEQKPLF